jgi:hypothetical protein
MSKKNNNLICLLTLILIGKSSYCQIDVDNDTIISEVYSEYINKKFKITASIPNEWSFYREKQDGRKNLHIEWGLPKVFDSIHGEKIENAVYIKAFRIKSIKNTSDMILSAYLGIAGSNTALSLEPDIGKEARIIYMDAANGVKYKGKVYFRFENNIGYRITFMATPMTYEQNLNSFENFISSLKFD